MNVAVTGVGGGVGQSIAKALQGTDYNVIGIDSEVLGTGLYATPKSYLGMYANDKKFIDRIIEVCKKENCKVLFPGLDVELTILSRNINKLRDSGILPIVSNTEVIEICDDKLETSRFLKKNNLPYINTYLLKNYSFNLDFPVILKPRKGGRRSIGTFLAKSKSEFNSITNNIKVDNYIVQDYIDGDEYTCGTVSFKSCCIGAILMRRILRDGDTYKAFVIKDNKLSNFVTNVVDTLRVFGACNVQLRTRDNIPYIFEINARCSGTTASRVLAGFNEPKMICDYYFKNINNPRFNIKKIAIFRYWNELVVSYSKINKMKSSGFIHNRGVKL